MVFSEIMFEVLLNSCLSNVSNFASTSAETVTIFPEFQWVRFQAVITEKYNLLIIQNIKAILNVFLNLFRSFIWLSNLCDVHLIS